MDHHQVNVADALIYHSLGRISLKRHLSSTTPSTQRRTSRPRNKSTSGSVSVPYPTN